MLNKFLTNISNNLLFEKNDFLLLAISGGADSVVLADLLHKGGFQFAFAHCNFSLRGKDADADEQFVLQLAERYGVKCFTKKTDTLQYAEDKGISIQMAARELRYQWFEELMKMYGFDYLLTAHHLDDNIETILLHQIRGTGIRGMTGIASKLKHLARPMLVFTKEEILNYAKEHHLPYREDVSNYSDKYLRNYLRLNIMPLMKNIQPDLYNVFQKNIWHFSEAENVVNAYVEGVLKEAVHCGKEVVRIAIDMINREEHLHLVLHHFLSRFHFNDEQIKDIVEHCRRHIPGRKFYSKTHSLFFDREYIYLISRDERKFHDEYVARNIEALNLFSGKYQFAVMKNTGSIHLKERSSSYICFDGIDFPLKLRHWRYGDKFRLMGTSYNKKLSDIFTDKKVPLHLKDKIWLLCNSKDEIMWISELNLVNDAYKVCDNTKCVIKISVCE
ncbi:MAG: tRNA(Ile)-lysidine synthase [Bacteroidia bacterium]|nr:MAG: tRNA(Ile)-lysidine synthase [Bacteroidia bacterium]